MKNEKDFDPNSEKHPDFFEHDSRYNFFDPDFDNFTELGRSIDWLGKYIENDQITLKTYVPKDRSDKIFKEGLKLPEKNSVRTDSGPYEEIAIFATTFKGEEDEELIQFKIPIDKVFVRSTYKGKDGKNFMTTLRTFINYTEQCKRPPFDSRRVEFLIYENIPTNYFILKNID